MTSDGTYEFTWDTADRLVQVNLKSDDSVVANYKYDSFGRRVYENVNGQETYFTYDGKSNRVLAEIDSAGTLKKYYTWGPTGQLLSLTVDGTTYYTVSNGHGDIIQLTDENGDVVASYTYDAWGNILSETGSAASLNPYRYAGYRYDEATGLYYLNARYYNPSLGRFLSRDAIFSNNLYVYCYNNPLKYVDPSGYDAADIGRYNNTHIKNERIDIHEVLDVLGAIDMGAPSPFDGADGLNSIIYTFQGDPKNAYISTLAMANDAAVGARYVGGMTSSIKWKGFSKGQLGIHFKKHGHEFGKGVTQSQYMKIAKEFALEKGTAFKEKAVGNFIVKYDPGTRRILVGHTKSREIRTFYKADFRDADPFEAAINLAKELSGIK